MFRESAGLLPLLPKIISGGQAGVDRAALDYATGNSRNANPRRREYAVPRRVGFSDQHAAGAGNVSEVDPCRRQRLDSAALSYRAAHTPQ